MAGSPQSQSPMPDSLSASIVCTQLKFIALSVCLQENLFHIEHHQSKNKHKTRSHGLSGSDLHCASFKLPISGGSVLKELKSIIVHSTQLILFIGGTLLLLLYTEVT